MVKELTEQGHEAIEWRGAAQIGHHVWHEDAVTVHFDASKRQLRCRCRYGGVTRHMRFISQ